MDLTRQDVIGLIQKIEIKLQKGQNRIKKQEEMNNEMRKQLEWLKMVLQHGDFN